MIRVAGRDRRALAAGGIALALLGFVRNGAMPYAAALQTAKAELAIAVADLSRDRRVLAQAARLEGELAIVDDEVRHVAQELLPGPAAAATRTLTRLVRASAERAPARLDRLEAGGPEAAEASMSRAVVSATGVSDLQGILILLADVEGTPGVSVRSLRLDSDGEDAATGQARPVVFRIELTGLFPPSPSEAS